MTITILGIIISALITNNIVFSQTLGICPFLGVSKKLKSAAGMGLAVTLVMTVSTLFTWVINKYVLLNLDMGYLRVIVFILVIAGLVQVLDILLKKFLPALYNAFGIYLALITTNCAVLGTAMLFGGDAPADIVTTFVTALFTGLGFLMALAVMAGVRERMETAHIPRFFKGFPIALLAAAIMAMAFFGFSTFSLGG
ncbi:MAG: electron transport complex subunit RsxA [Firmicutes bacterium]|nr:electron transport complex subunit RsxA [Bacillota bacterium]